MANFATLSGGTKHVSRLTWAQGIEQSSVAHVCCAHEGTAATVYVNVLRKRFRSEDWYRGRLRIGSRGEGNLGSRQRPRRLLGQAHRGARVARMLAQAVFSTRHPILVQIVATRRCNLACAYCYEYDHSSKPVPLEVLLQRIDRLASLGTSIITISGGEPLLHPDLERVVAYTRERGIIATVITNGYLLTEGRIATLNSARLDYLQISIDNVSPDGASMKSMKVLDQKLRLLSRYADFGVNVNTVIGSGVKDPEESLLVARRARELGFSTSVGIVHDGKGKMKALSEHEWGIYRAIKGSGGRSFAVVDRFQEGLAKGRPTDWRCRAGARYLYVDEFGLVHWCSQQRGYPALPLENYSREEMRRQYFTKKAYAPYCTIQCVHRASIVDSWRHPQMEGRVLPVQARTGEGRGT